MTIETSSSRLTGATIHAAHEVVPSEGRKGERSLASTPGLPPLRPILAPLGPPQLEPGPPPSFSIVIAAYQAAGTIAEAVESALAQTAPAHEVIVVDDGSTDATQAVLSRYLEKIIYRRQENRGAPAASNAGFRRATGDFVAILDADDVYEPERLEALAELAVRRPDLDILMTDAHLDTGQEVIGSFFEYAPFAVADQKIEILDTCFIAWPAVRRELMIAARGFEESLPIGYDWECWIRLLHAGSVAGAIDAPLMRYRVGGPSLTSNRVAALRSRVTVLERASQLDLSDEERRALERFLPEHRHRALLAEAERALRDRSADARGRALAVALTAGVRPSARIRALAATLAPRLAGRRLDALEAKTGFSRIRRGAVDM